MKVIAVIGSPRPQGNSTALAHAFLKGAEAAGHQTVVYDLNTLTVKGCQGCRTCKEKGCDCILQDDLVPYWHDLHEAGALVVSAPNYAGQVCGPMVTYMNRHYCLLDKDWRSRLRPGKKVLGIFSQGNANRKVYLNHYQWYMHDFQNRDMTLLDILVHTSEDSVAPDSPLAVHAYRLGLEL